MTLLQCAALGCGLYATVGAGDAGQLAALEQAIAAGDEEQVQQILLTGTTINIAGVEPPLLHHAVKSGSETIASLLLKHGAAVNGRESENGTTAMHVAAAANNRDLMRLLIHHGGELHAKDSAGGHTPLHVAAKHGHVRMIGLLFDVGASLDLRSDVDGDTALHIAAKGQHEAASQKLMRLGSLENIHAKDGGGKTALDHWPLLRDMSSFREQHHRKDSEL